VPTHPIEGTPTATPEPDSTTSTRRKLLPLWPADGPARGRERNWETNRGARKAGWSGGWGSGPITISDLDLALGSTPHQPDLLPALHHRSPHRRRTQRLLDHPMIATRVVTWQLHHPVQCHQITAQNTAVLASLVCPAQQPSYPPFEPTNMITPRSPNRGARKLPHRRWSDPPSFDYPSLRIARSGGHRNVGCLAIWHDAKMPSLHISPTRRAQKLARLQSRAPLLRLTTHSSHRRA